MGFHAESDIKKFSCFFLKNSTLIFKKIKLQSQNTNKMVVILELSNFFVWNFEDVVEISSSDWNSFGKARVLSEF